MKPRLQIYGVVFTTLLAAGPVAAADSSAAATPGTILATPLEKTGGYVKLGFDRLAAFPLNVPDYDPAAKPGATPPSIDGQIPDVIRKLDGQKVVVTGFMQPVRMDGESVAECMLSSGPAQCCYSVPLNVNEWVVVKMKPGANMPVIMDVPVVIYGTLRVHGQFENGYLTAIYTLDGERMEQVKAPTP